MQAQAILDTCDLLSKDNCKIVDGSLYERCTLDDSRFMKAQFVNTDEEIYYFKGNNHVYRVFFNNDDYDYVTDVDTLRVLDLVFNESNAHSYYSQFSSIKDPDTGQELFVETSTGNFWLDCNGALLLSGDVDTTDDEVVQKLYAEFMEPTGE